MAKHALLSPSAAVRWLYCTRAPRLEEQFPNSESTYAAEGTLAHAVAELTAWYWLGERTDEQYEAALNVLKTDDLYSPAMTEHAIEYAKIIQGKALALADSVVALEQALDISAYAQKCRGTGDCIIVGEGVLEIIDYKYGKGHRVSAEGNPQMRLYALGAIKAFSVLYDFDTVRMTIFQPRLTDGLSSDEMSVSELLDWGKTFVKPRAKLAYAGKGDFYPSESTCRFCRAGAMCKARADYNLSLFDEKSELLTLNEVAELLGKAADIKQWLSAIETKVFSELASGTEVKGWKLVAGRSNRKYIDEEKVVSALTAAGIPETDIFERKLITITALEKALGKKRFSELLGDLIEKPAGKPTLAPETDIRPAITIAEQIIKEFDKE